MPNPDPQADLVTAFDAGLDSYYGHVEHETRGNAELAARAVLSALGNPHERVAELEALLAGSRDARLRQLLRDLKAIEDIAHKAQPVYGEPYWQDFERIYRIAREAQATDVQLGPENNQIAT